MRQLRTPSLAATFAAAVLLLSACDSLDESVGPSNSDPVSTSTAAYAKTNSAPKAYITTPTNRTSVARGISVLFSGSGNDPEDGALTGASLVWTTNLNSTIGTGISFTRSDLAVGTHTVTLTGKDSQGATFTHNRILVVTAAVNQPPVAAIASPASGATITQGNAVSFSGSGIDPEQGALTGAALIWSSSLSGPIGTGTSFSVSSLAIGTHTISMTAKDAGNLVSTVSRSISIVATATTNAAPTAYISTPSSQTTAAQGISVLFSGSGNDPEDGALTGASLVWTTNLNGTIGTGISFTRSDLAVGTHTVTLTGKDSQGAIFTHNRILIVTSAVNQPPVAAISSPAVNASYVQAVSVPFSGSASDAEDGVLSGAALVWRSDRDGQIGTGTSFTRSSLSVGQHQISLTATDSRGAASVNTRAISITSSPVEPVASVSVTLSAAAAQVGAPVTAAAVLRSSSGVVLTGRVVAWSTSNGALASVNPTTGIVSPLSTGTVGVIATSEGKTGQATLTISAVSTQPSPTGANEPTGMTLITDRAFNCATNSCEGGWGGQSANFTIVQDGTAPRSSSSVGQMRYPAGMSGGVGPAQTWRGLGNRKTVYISTWLKFSSNFQNHSTGVNKVLHVWINGINRLVLIGRGQNLSSVIALQQLAAPYNNGSGQNATSVHLLPNVVSTAAMTRNQWHKIEIVLVANTPGLANGSVTMYQNGTKVLEYSGIMYAAAGGNGAWEQMNWNPTWGGVGGTVTSDMYMWMDHLYASGK